MLYVLVLLRTVCVPVIYYGLQRKRRGSEGGCYRPAPRVGTMDRAVNSLDRDDMLIKFYYWITNGMIVFL